MTIRENTWTERKPYPPEAREKYGASTPSLGAHEEHTDLVEASHVAAPSEREIRARRAALAPPPHVIGYGGIGELDALELLEAEATFGIDPGTPPSTRPTGAASSRTPLGDGAHDEAEERAAAASDEDDESGEDDEDDEDDDGRASHAPEASGLRSTFPSLDRISLTS